MESQRKRTERRERLVELWAPICRQRKDRLERRTRRRAVDEAAKKDHVTICSAMSKRTQQHAALRARTELMKRVRVIAAVRHEPALQRRWRRCSKRIHE